MQSIDTESFTLRTENTMIADDIKTIHVHKENLKHHMDYCIDTERKAFVMVCIHRIAVEKIG